MKLMNIILWLALLIVPIFLQVLFIELSGRPRKLQDAFMYEQLIAEMVNQQDTSELSAAPGVHTVCVFPNNTNIFPTGENSLLLVGGKNKGGLPLQIIGLRAYICRPNDYQHPVQDLKFRLTSWIVPPKYTGTWEYVFSVSQSVKGDMYNLVGSIIYAIDADRYQNTFYNGTVNIVEAHDPIRVVDAIVSVVLAVFYIGIGVYAYCVINNGIIKKVKKFQKLADRPGQANPQGNRRRSWR